MNPVSKMQALISAIMQSGLTWEEIAEKGIDRAEYDRLQVDNYNAVSEGIKCDEIEYNMYLEEFKALLNCPGYNKQWG